MKLDQAIEKFKSKNGETFVVEAKVEKVCRKKGCWMGLKSEHGPVRVTFKNYGFFVPTSLAGQTVVAEGVFSEKQLTLKETKHYVKDDGGDPAKVTEPGKEIHFVATGVALK